MKRSGIYFLIWRKKIIYIGRSVDVDRRLYEHRDVRYSYSRVIECAVEKLPEYEKRLITYFKPKYNKWLNPDKSNRWNYLPLKKVA